MTPWARVVAARPDDLRPLPGTHKVKGPLQAVLLCPVAHSPPLDK